MTKSTASLTSTLAPRTADQRREHYEIEKELAGRLRRANQTERRALYHSVYDERLRRIPSHPLLTKARDVRARDRGAAPQIRLLADFLKPGGVFLEVGPGDCSVAFGVARQAYKVYAVDVSDGLIQDRQWPGNFEFRFSDGISVPVPAGTIDLAYSNQVMEHLHWEDGLEQLRNIYRALALGGAYLCVTPNRLSGPWDISRGFDEEATGLHLKEYTLAELAESFQMAGFQRVRAFVSYHGHRLTPLLPLPPFVAFERMLQVLPAGLRREVAHVLTAVKLIGYK